MPLPVKDTVPTERFTMIRITVQVQFMGYARLFLFLKWRQRSRYIVAFVGFSGTFLCGTAKTLVRFEVAGLSPFVPAI